MAGKQYILAKDSADYARAQTFDKLHVGDRGVYFKDGFRIRFIPYEEMDQAFIRVHEVNGRLCCGSAVFHYYRMVFMRDGKEFADMISEKEDAMDQALAAIAAKAPAVAVGLAPA